MKSKCGNDAYKLIQIHGKIAATVQNCNANP